MNNLADIFRAIAWTFCAAAMLPAAYRVTTRHPRAYDPVWVCVLMLALNRLSYFFQMSRDFSNWTATFLAIVMGCLALVYQHHER
jgi:hypothetical protein